MSTQAWSARGLDGYYKKLFEKLAELGVVLVTSAGNDGAFEAQNRLPAAFGLSTTIPIITVGALDHDLVRSKTSQGVYENTVWAPGWMSVNNKEFRGSSLATALVSGLAAYFMSTVEFNGPIDTRSQDVKDYIVQQARREKDSYPLIVSKGRDQD